MWEIGHARAVPNQQGQRTEPKRNQTNAMTRGGWLANSHLC